MTAIPKLDHALPLPAKCKPVSLRRKPHATEGSTEENYAWLPYLADGIGKHCVGRDPLTHSRRRY